MSRIGKKVIIIPQGVVVDLQAQHILVKGPKGALERDIHPNIAVEMKEGKLFVSRAGETKMDRSLHGLTRALVANMVTGVTDGFMKALELTGVGYKAQVQENALILQVGYTHPVLFPLPDGISVSAEIKKAVTSQVSYYVIKVEGRDREAVGAFADRVRKVRRPDPYKGKGVKYAGEIIRRKAGKALGKSAGK
ncbi:MAG: 50S ribosomal protein L6 [Coprothermobacterota bacterium]|nr:50S ribosomal protein L6 [Coprothermobacterota bacterium]